MHKANIVEVGRTDTHAYGVRFIVCNNAETIASGLACGDSGNGWADELRQAVTDAGAIITAAGYDYEVRGEYHGGPYARLVQVSWYAAELEDATETLHAGTPEETTREVRDYFGEWELLYLSDELVPAEMLCAIGDIQDQAETAMLAAFPEDDEDQEEDGDEDAGVYTVHLRDDSDGAHSEEFTASPGTEEEQDAEAWAEAETIARQWAEDGDWGEDGASVRVTYWIEDARGTYEDAERDITVDIEPDHAAKIRTAMTCCGELTGCGEDPEDHDWTGEGMGGCDENPGVWSLGGTTIHVAERCTRCGLVRKTTDPGSQRNPGDHVRVEYEPGEDQGQDEDR